MKVYFRPPVYEGEKLIFPNSQTVPPGWQSPEFDMKIWPESKKRLENLQYDLMKLAERVYEYLTKSEMIGNAIVFYRSQSLTLKGKLKKEIEPAIFLFGCVVLSEGGESKLTVYIKESKILFEVRGEGLCADVVKNVVQNFHWYPWLTVAVCRFSDYLQLVKVTFNSHVRNSLEDGYAFNVPLSEHLVASEIV